MNSASRKNIQDVLKTGKAIFKFITGRHVRLLWCLEYENTLNILMHYIRNRKQYSPGFVLQICIVHVECVSLFSIRIQSVYCTQSLRKLIIVTKVGDTNLTARIFLWIFYITSYLYKKKYKRILTKLCL